ncbi:NAD-binding protein [Saccharothrix sp. AJ9571]|nr:NAD-binding protein [Saccharothrix sp. AJ9571]
MEELSSITAVIGYGRTGALAVMALTTEPAGLPGQLVVLERRAERLAAAAAAGVRAIAGDATDAAVLRRSGIPRAAAVVITCMNDATALELTGLVRHLTTSAKLVVAARAPSQVAALRRAGADLAVIATRVTGELAAPAATGLDLARATRLLLSGDERERRPAPDEVGVPVQQCGPTVVAVRRAGVRHWWNDPAVSTVRADDMLISWVE